MKNYETETGKAWYRVSTGTIHTESKEKWYKYIIELQSDSEFITNKSRRILLIKGVQS